MNMMNPYSSSISRNNPRNYQTAVNLQTTCDSKTLVLLREDLIGELSAISQYDAHINEINNDLVKTVLRQIRDEERVHAGELTALIDVLCTEEGVLRAKGKEEVMQMMGPSK